MNWKQSIYKSTTQLCFLKKHINIREAVIRSSPSLRHHIISDSGLLVGVDAGPASPQPGSAARIRPAQGGADMDVAERGVT